MTGRVLIPPKLAAETRTEPIDFSPFLLTGQSISSAIATCTVYSGTDAAPSSVIGSVGVVSPLVNVKLTGGVLGVIYQIRVDATLAAAAGVLSISFYLAIIPDVP